MEEVIQFIVGFIPVEKQPIAVGVLIVLLSASEIIGLNPKWKSNSIIQLVHNGLLMLKDAVIKKKVEAPKVEEKK